MTYLEEGIIMMTVFAGIIIIILIAVFVMALSNRNFMKIRDEANQKRYEDLAAEIKATQNLFETHIIEILDQVKKVLPK